MGNRYARSLPSGDFGLLHTDETRYGTGRRAAPEQWAGFDLASHPHRMEAALLTVESESKPPTDWFDAADLRQQLVDGSAEGGVVVGPQSGVDVEGLDGAMQPRLLNGRT